MSHPHRALLISLLWSHGVASAEPPAIQPNVWYLQVPSDPMNGRQIPVPEGSIPATYSWVTGDGPAWISIGRTANVLCIVPQTVEHEGKKYINRVAFEVYSVITFSEDQLPAQVTRTQKIEWQADSLPEEVSPTWKQMNFTSGPFRYSIRFLLRGDRVAIPKSSDTQDENVCFKWGKIRIEIAEMLHRPSQKLRLRYPDSHPPPDTAWYDELNVRPPWVDISATRGGRTAGMLKVEGPGYRFLEFEKASNDSDGPALPKPDMKIPASRQDNELEVEELN